MKNTWPARTIASFTAGSTSPTKRKNSTKKGYKRKKIALTRAGSADTLSAAPESISSASSSSLPLVALLPWRRTAAFRRSNACRKFLGSAASSCKPSGGKPELLSKGAHRGVGCGHAAAGLWGSGEANPLDCGVGATAAWERAGGADRIGVQLGVQLGVDDSGLLKTGENVDGSGGTRSRITSISDGTGRPGS